MGPEVALLGIDMRSKRCKEEILPQVLAYRGCCGLGWEDSLAQAVRLWCIKRAHILGQLLDAKHLACIMKKLRPSLRAISLLSRANKWSLPKATYALLERTVLALSEGVRHLIVMSGVPLVFPRVSLTYSGQARPILAELPHLIAWHAVAQQYSSAGPLSLGLCENPQRANGPKNGN